MTALTTEDLLTSPKAFGLDTASPCQRAACRIIDGRPLGDLAEDPEVLDLVGGPEALEALPSQSGVAPTLTVILAAIRTAKTMTAGAAASRMAMTVDTSGLKHGEVPRVSIVSLKLDTSAVAFSQIVGAWEASPMLSRLIVGRTADVLTVRHPSGRPVEIACVAGARAGSGLVGRWSAGVIFDEAPRMNGRDDGVVNLDDALTSVQGRLLPGASILAIGSPWAPTGPIYDLTAEHWGKPSAHVVVLRGTGPMLNPAHWTPERCEQLRERDPVAHQTDVEGEFADPESGLLNPFAVRRNTREDELELPPGRGRYVAAVDPSEGGAGSNGFSLAIVGVERSKPHVSQPAVTRFRVALAREWRGTNLESIWEEIAGECRRYGLAVAATDQYAASANAALAKRYGLTLQKHATTAGSKLEDWTNFATLVHTDCIELPPDRVLRRDLLSIRKRATQNGYAIILPRTSDGRHCDLAVAVCSAVTRGTRAASGGVYVEEKGRSATARAATRPLDTFAGGGGGRDITGLHGTGIDWYPPRDGRRRGAV